MQVMGLITSAGFTKVVFDRNGFIYHGRVKALAEAAREARALYPDLFAPGSPPPTNAPLGEREVYLLAWREGVAVGCGALRRLDAHRGDALEVVVDGAGQALDEQRHAAREQQAKQQEGISFLLIDMKTPGITVRPIIGITLVLMSVFLPAAFVPGITGQMYRQFALVIAATAVLSGIVRAAVHLDGRNVILDGVADHRRGAGLHRVL